MVKEIYLSDTNDKSVLIVVVKEYILLGQSKEDEELEELYSNELELEELYSNELELEELYSSDEELELLYSNDEELEELYSNELELEELYSSDELELVETDVDELLYPELLDEDELCSITFQSITLPSFSTTQISPS